MTDHPFFRQGLYIFNPDTDFALASGSKFYTPPAVVIALRSQNALIPALYAAPQSTILCLDSEYSRNAQNYIEHQREYATEKGIRIIGTDRLSDFFISNPELPVYPWGWNPALIHFLSEHGATSSQLLTQQQSELLRSLAHRRTTIAANQFLCEAGICNQNCIPVELQNIEQAEEFLTVYPEAWFKAPWSSSGRGVISAKELYPNETLQWVRGTIRRQHSVMAETPADKTLDFATEWFCSSETVEFAGFSLFETSSRGKYKRNINETQSNIELIIAKHIDIPISSVIESQKELIERLFVFKYIGPLGIDMMACADGTLRPCVEINLRMTMGHVSLFAGLP